MKMKLEICGLGMVSILGRDPEADDHVKESETITRLVSRAVAKCVDGEEKPDSIVGLEAELAAAHRLVSTYLDRVGIRS